MEFSLIIPSLNKAPYLDIVLASLEKANYINYGEVIVIDDGSIDNTQDCVMSYMDKLHINYIKNNVNCGRSIARNIGIHAAKSDALLFLDDDRLVTKDFINRHLSLLHQLPDHIIIGDTNQIFLSNMATKKELILTDLKNDLSFVKKMSRVDKYRETIKKMFHNGLSGYAIQWLACIFASAAISKKLLLLTGLFDEEFVGWGCEDLELGFRIVNDHKVSVYYDNDNVCYHLEHERTNNILIEFDDNLNYFYKKHPTLSVELFGAFKDGTISLEEYDLSVKQNFLVASNIEGTYYLPQGKFRAR